MGIFALYAFHENMEFHAFSICATYYKSNGIRDFVDKA